MLIRADPSNNTLSLLSFPRDLQVPIYCDGADVPVTTDRINSAWRVRAAGQGTLDTVAHLTGLPINYVITVDFHGFKLLVNKLHGVYIDGRPPLLQHRQRARRLRKIDLHPGYQKLDGEQALDFVRFRHTDSDLYRLARQQLFLDALKDRLAASFSHHSRSRSLVGAMKGNVEVVKPGARRADASTRSSPTSGSAITCRPGTCSGPRSRTCRLRLPERRGVRERRRTSRRRCSAFLHPDVTLPKRANAVALGRKPKTPKTKALKPAEITTLVLNGTTILGLARDTSYKLAVAGFHTVQLPSTDQADAPSRRTTRTTSTSTPCSRTRRGRAQQLAVAMRPAHDVAPLPPRSRRSRSRPATR